MSKPQIVKDFDNCMTLEQLAEKYTLSIHDVIKLVYIYKTRGVKCVERLDID